MIRCPLCHKLHKDPLNLKAGRARICIRCHDAKSSPPSKPRSKPNRKPPPKPDAAPAAVPTPKA